MTSISDQKAAARKTATARRKAVYSAAAGAELIQHFPIKQFAGAVVSGFWPLAGEIDVRPLLKSLHTEGHALGLPCTPPAGQPLIMRQWQPEDALKDGPYDTREPYPDQPEIFPTVVLVPLLAFAANGKRLGYGGGYYDRTLAALKARYKESEHDVFACGVAFAGQEAPDLPTGEFDQPLDGILTDTYFRAFT